MKKLLLSSLLLLALAACNDESQTANPAPEKTEGTETVETEMPEYAFKDNVVTLTDLTIKIKDHKIIQAGEPGNEYGDKPVIAFWYDTTNHSDKEIDPITAWLIVFEAIQDNKPNAVNKLNFGGLPDMSFIDTQMEIIKKDGTLANAIAYELDDSETPVILVATLGINGDELGSAEYAVK